MPCDSPPLFDTHLLKILRSYFLNNNKQISHDRKLTLRRSHDASGRSKWLLMPRRKPPIHLASRRIRFYVTCGSILFLMSRPQLEWLSHIKQCKSAARWQAWRSWKMRMRANRLIIQNTHSQQELLILTPACTKSLINECFQLGRRQPVHSYLAFSRWTISTAESKWQKGRRATVEGRGRERNKNVTLLYILICCSSVLKKE